jgi:hypothetical protein
LWWAESGTFVTMAGHSCGSGGSGRTSAKGGKNDETRRPVICRRRRGKRTFLMFSCLWYAMTSRLLGQESPSKFCMFCSFAVRSSGGLGGGGIKLGAGVEREI